MQYSFQVLALALLAATAVKAQSSPSNSSAAVTVTEYFPSATSMVTFPGATRNPSNSPLPTILKPIPPESAILIPTTISGTAGTLTAVPCIDASAATVTSPRSVSLAPDPQTTILSLSSLYNGYCAYVTTAPAGSSATAAASTTQHSGGAANLKAVGVMGGVMGAGAAVLGLL